MKMIFHHPHHYLRKALCLFLSVVGGCQAASSSTETGISPSPADEDIVARVNGQPISKATLMETLYQARGRKILDELILLDMIRQHAAQQNVSLTPELATAELELILEDMAPGKSPREKHALLRYMLQSRGLTRGEFDLTVQRQALLRRLVDPEVAVTEEMIADEYESQHGRQVLVREIVTDTLRQIETVQRKLNEGVEFTELVRNFSQDQRSLGLEGLVGPFSRTDREIPAEVRKAAFSLAAPGQYSEIISYTDGPGQNWWVLLRLEKIIPPTNIPLPEVREQLIGTLRRKTITQRMFDLQKSLEAKTQIQILDPVLKRGND